MLRAVGPVEMLDDLLAAGVPEVDVDVGRLPRSSDKNRSKRRRFDNGSTREMPRVWETTDPAAEPRPWQGMPFRFAKLTTSWTRRKNPARSSLAMTASSWSSWRAAFRQRARSPSP
ncbi:MAG: hypothetical protein U0841_21870 [Chloroflexia bacterium]